MELIKELMLMEVAKKPVSHLAEWATEIINLMLEIPSLKKFAKHEMTGRGNMSFNVDTDLKVVDVKKLLDSAKAAGFTVKDFKRDDSSILLSKTKKKCGLHIQWYSSEEEREADGIPDGTCMVSWYDPSYN